MSRNLNRWFLETSVVIAILVAVCCSPIRARAADAPDKAGIEFFESKIRPVLVQHCYECHSAKSDDVKGNLRVDTREAIRAGGDNGPAVVPGKPDESFLLPVIRYEECDYQMPPEGKLPEETIADFQEWIEMGAPDPREEKGGQPTGNSGIDLSAGREFWAFQPVQAIAPPAVKNDAWPLNEIDRFILARQEAAGIAPVADTSPDRLLRRLYFDLIGLPPTPAEQEVFANQLARASETMDSPAAERAIAEVVDRLLASPRFGERWARHWMDLARYADSNGLDQNLTHYNAWRYRNYLIDAFNNDKPYDRFIVEQLAGDLLPYENDRQLKEQLVATGFLMVGPKQLSERDKEKLRMDVVDEQIDTTGRVFMGMTLGCARCHDHKFDPIPSRDYYGLAGIFRSTTTVDGIKLGNVFVSGWKVRPLPIEPAHAAALKEHEDSLASIETPLKQAREALKKLGQPSKFPRQVADLPGIVVDDREAEKQGDWKDSTYSPNYVGSGYIHDDRMGKGEKSVTFRPKLTAAGMYEVRISYAGSGGRSTRVPVTITHADGEDRVLVDQSKPASIEGLFHSLGQFRFESPEQAAVVIATDGTDDGHVIVDAVQFLPQGAAAAETPKDEAEPQDEEDDAEKQRLAERRKTLEQQIKQLEADLAELKKQTPPPAPMAMAAADIDEPTDFVQLIRGNHNRPGDPVPRGFLQVAMRSESDDVAITPHQSGRLELAQWIASADNPLTTRVFANRVWHWLMGEGLVRSVDNFGHLGERPSHPELLDYLAARLVQQDWSVKQLVREVVLSRTYRLASQHDAAAFDVDPENRLRWRYPRRRLDAECIRDAMLAISGDLDFSPTESMVADLPEQAFGNNGKSPIDYDALAFRSVYLPILRSDVPSMLSAFDFADPEMVTGARSNTTVPAQALLMMNSPFVRRQAERTADHLLAWQPDGVDVAASEEQRVRRAFRLIVGREATESDVTAAIAFVSRPTAAAEGESSDSAALRRESWTQLCQSLLASTEFRFVE